MNGATTTTYGYTAGGSPLAEKTGSTASFYLRDLHGDVVGARLYRRGEPGHGLVRSLGQTSFLGYQGDMTDPDTNQVDMGTRWYAAGLGRFTSRDVVFGELTSPMMLNQHVYGGMNPVTMWDPSGMGACTMVRECVTTTKSGTTKAVGGNPGSAYHPYHATASAVTATPRAPEPGARTSRFDSIIGPRIDYSFDNFGAASSPRDKRRDCKPIIGCEIGSLDDWIQILPLAGLAWGFGTVGKRLLKEGDLKRAFPALALATAFGFATACVNNRLRGRAPIPGDDETGKGLCDYRGDRERSRT